MRSIYKRMRISFVNIGRGGSWWRLTPVRERRSSGRSSITDKRRTSSGRMLLERVKVEAETYISTLYLL